MSSDNPIVTTIVTTYVPPYGTGIIWRGGSPWAPFGTSASTMEFRGSHRRSYTLADAEAVAAWLREREAGYPPHEALMPTQASPS